MALRRILLNGNFEEAKETLRALENTKENYDKLCEFYSECEVKGISLEPETIQLIIDYVVEYRLKYSNENEIPEKYEENISERLKFLEHVVDEYLNCEYKNPIEEIVLLKCVARILRPLVNANHNKQNSNKNCLLKKVPWNEVQFLICIFVAVKSDRKHEQYKYVDDYFQLLVHEDLIRDVLQLMLNCMRGNSFDDEKWKQFNNTYTILQMYYLLLKAHNYNHSTMGKYDINDRSSLRAYQVMGECCQRMSKLRYEGFDDTIYPMCDVKWFSTELSRERNKLSHFEELLTEKQKEVFADSTLGPLSTPRIFIFIVDMIQMVRNEIEKIVVEDFKNIIGNGKVEKLLKRVKDIKKNKTIKHFNPLLETIAQIIDYISKCGLGDNFTNILLSETLHHMKMIPINVKSYDVFSFIKWINRCSQQPIGCIKNKLNAITHKSFMNITTLMTIFSKLLPDSVKAENLAWLDQIEEVTKWFVTDPAYNSSREDSIIEEFIEKIRGCIKNQKDKEKFNEIEYILIKKRSLYLEYRIFKDLESIISDWLKDNKKQKITERLISSYNDPLNLFVDSSNISDYKKIDNFLKEINWENREAIIEIARKDLSNELKNSLENILISIGKNEIADELNLLDCFEILKKMDIDQCQDYNYLDFDCSIPVARNMRNYLAHGDIYVEFFCPDLKDIVLSHLKIISKSYKDFKRIGFWRPDDFETVSKDLNKHRKWAREIWETLKFNNNFQKMEEIETFKVRDYNNLSAVNYNLRNINTENKLLMYLIKKVTENPTFETNLLLEKMLKESKNYNLMNILIDTILKESKMDEYLTKQKLINNNLPNMKTLEFFIDTFLMTQDLQEQRCILCTILCFNCKDLNIFREVFSIYFDTTELLCYAIANNQLDIADFLSEQIKKGDNFDKILKQALKSDNMELVSNLIDRICNNSLEHDIDWSRLVISAAKVGNIEILNLLSTNIKSMSTENRNSLIKNTINFNSNTRLCKFVVEKYLLPISKDKSELLLSLCCFNERYEILRYLLEEVIPKDHWDRVRKTFLVSCLNTCSIEMVEYLIEKGAYLDSKTLNEFLPVFESAEIVEVLLNRFGTSALHENSKELTFVRNENVAEVFLRFGYSLDWFEIDSLGLEFILKNNPEPKINYEKLMTFIRRNSSETVTSLLKYLNDRKVQFPFQYLPVFVTEIKIRKKKWLSELNWKEPTQEECDDIIDQAIESKYLIYARMVLRKGTNLNVYLGLKKLQFFEKSDKQEQILKLFQEFGVDLNEKYNGQTLLDIAIEEGKGTVTDSMRFLSKCGVKCKYEIDFYNLKAQDLLRFGVLEKNPDVFQDALELGANINFKYKEYRFGTVLHMAAYHIKMRKSKLVDSIFKLGIDTSIRDIDDCTVFDLHNIYDPTVDISKFQNKLPAINFFWAGGGRNFFDFIKSILKLGTDTSIRDIDDCTTFELDNIYDPKVKISKFQNKLPPFHLFWAGVVRDDIVLMEVALEKGANVNCYWVGFEKDIALHVLASNGRLKSIEFLLNNGADPLRTNQRHQYPIEQSILLDNCDVFKRLFSKCLDLGYYFEIAVVENSVEIVKFLLKNGVDVNTKILRSFSALTFASLKSSKKGLKLAEVLVEHKINITKLDVNVAWKKENYELVKLILNKVYNYTKIVQEFEIAIDKGLNINFAPRSDLGTYLHLACYFQDKEIVKFLLQNGANFLQNDSNKKNPITLALESNNSEIKKLFFKPLLVKFYSMWSKYPSEEFLDFHYTDPFKDFDYIIVFWFDMILKVSELLDNDDIDNLTPFELLASGLWLNKKSYIEKAIDSGVNIKQCLRELVFVSLVLNHHKNRSLFNLGLDFLNEFDFQREIEKANELCSNKFYILIKNIKHPRLRELFATETNNYFKMVFESVSNDGTDQFVDRRKEIRKQLSAIEKILNQYSTDVESKHTSINTMAQNFLLILHKLFNNPKTVQEFENAIENGLNIASANNSNLKTYIRIAFQSLLTNKTDEEYKMENGLNLNNEIYIQLLLRLLELEEILKKVKEKLRVSKQTVNDFISKCCSDVYDVETPLAIISDITEFTNISEKMIEEITDLAIKFNELDSECRCALKNYKLDKLKFKKPSNYPKTVQEFEIAFEKGLNVNFALHSDLGTYLHLACHYQHKEIVEFLLQNGANFLRNGSFGKNPITIALDSNNSEIKKLLFKPLLIKFYSMFSKYPSEEFLDFYYADRNNNFGYIIVFWFDMILMVSGLLDNDDIQNLTPFELLASGLWLNNISYIEKAIDSGVDINQCLSELVFVSYVLNGNNQNFLKILIFIFFNGGNVSKENKNAKLLCQNLLNKAIKFLNTNKFELHPHFKKAIRNYKLNDYKNRSISNEINILEREICLRQKIIVSLKEKLEKLT